MSEKENPAGFSDKNINRLAKLKGLLDSGAITRQEYNEQKDKILGKQKKPHSVWNTIALVICILILMFAVLYLIANV